MSKMALQDKLNDPKLVSVPWLYGLGVGQVTVALAGETRACAVHLCFEAKDKARKNAEFVVLQNGSKSIQDSLRQQGLPERLLRQDYVKRCSLTR